LPTFGEVVDFHLTDQEGRAFEREGMRGRTWVSAFFFTRCPSVCPRLIAGLLAVDEAALGAQLPLGVVGFSVDPEHDTPPVLKRYGQDHRIPWQRWTLATGDLTVIERVADGFRIAVEGRPDADADHFGILHGTHAMLVDPALRIRGHYRVTEASERDRLIGDVRRVTT
jgi:protein SCO1/2